MSVSVLIVEDEPLIADDIALILERAGYDIFGIQDNADDVIRLLNQDKPDIALLDINIEGEKDGIHLAHLINQKYHIPFVFLTSYYDRNTLARAKATNPGGYVVKPYDEGDLIANIELTLSKGHAKNDIPSDKVFVRNQGQLQAVDPSEILYAESEDNYTKIFIEDKKLVVSHTLKSVEEQLTPFAFIRIHKSYLVNFQKITSIHEGYVFIEEIKIPIGRAYREDFLKRLAIL
ncbi:two component transcriptional regulator, LytTR family [Ekhidna lutea]|uniref:Two component transcriptional regulator, LytTR family n=1 Tax=Ekhidna lutea TaxID=447679 RepID=A0A239IUH5_EKHLU|nr:LytTR family transcriptional regulator DNA-binding domain-containing protein [Ekhidna lutea]SNS97175.1 two component transcriptional regulator, LytTR family [Ekhidna lutea]